MMMMMMMMINKPYYIGTHTGKSLEQKLKDKITRFSFVIHPI